MGLLGRRSRLSGRASPAAGLVLVLALGGCSFVPDWVDPTEWSYRWANPVNWYQGVFGDEGSEVTLRPEPVSAADDEFPRLDSVPDRPATVETAEARAALAEGLVADREQARYTDEVIRTGAEPEPIEMAAAEPTAGGDSMLVEEIDALVPATPSERRQAVVLDPLVPMPEPPPAVTIAPLELDELTAVPTIAALPEPDLGRAAAPAAPAVIAPAVVFVAFAPDQGTLSQVFAALLGESATTVTTAPASMAFSAPAAEPLGAGATAVPDIVRETYNAALSAQATSVGAQAFEVSPSAAQGGVYQSAVIKFSVGSSRIAPSHHGALDEVVAEHKSRGGFVRVVGHASSRTRDLPIDRHMLVNFRISLDRAQAVAAELVRLGVSPSAIFVEARSDTEPVFYESMPAGEAENRRAEVFLEF